MVHPRPSPRSAQGASLGSRQPLLGPAWHTSIRCWCSRLFGDGGSVSLPCARMLTTASTSPYPLSHRRHRHPAFWFLSRCHGKGNREALGVIVPMTQWLHQLLRWLPARASPCTTRCTWVDLWAGVPVVSSMRCVDIEKARKGA